MPTCKQCGSSAVRWVKRPGAKPYEPRAFVLLDAEPSPVGIYRIVNDRVVPIDMSDPKDAPRYTPHEATCEHRTRSERRTPVMEG